ncbi:unnamed protein product [Jaminaea pallidilutea]
MRGYVFLLVFALAMTLVSAHGLDRHHHRRDVYSQMRGGTGGGYGPRLNSTGTRPTGARPTSFKVPTAQGKQARLFAWYSKTPHDESDAEQVFIIIHGVKRNADSYWATLNNAWADARNMSLGSASPNSIRVAPLFFSSERDEPALNATTLGWGDPSGWTGGDGSTHPSGSNLSPFGALDALLDHFSSMQKFPKVKRVTFVAHGAGAQVLQRYAVLGADSKRPSLAVRYVIADPSTMLYFTRDRPVEVNATECPRFNDFRYGFSNYSAPYPLAGSRASLFKRYLKRDVRYLIGEEDTRSDKGDQLCGGKATGGPIRRDRSYNYWAYLRLLAGKASIPPYPGYFPALDKSKSKAANVTSVQNFPKSTATDRSRFRTAAFKHKLFKVPDAGHNHTAILRSSEGLAAIFGS